MTVNEVSKLTGVSIRTLQYYDTVSYTHLKARDASCPKGKKMGIKKTYM